MATWLLLALARILTATLPFRIVRRLLGSRSTPAPAEAGAPGNTPHSTTDARGVGRARSISWLVAHAAARTPWRSDCYPQALVARWLLRASRVPHTVTFGVRRADDGELLAHAWVSAAGVPVCGGSGASWAAVGSFAWPPAASRPR